MMFPAERRHRILELVRQNGAVSLRDLAVRVGTSEVTVRRDVRPLEADGLIDRQHGGAMLPGRLTREPCPCRKPHPHRSSSVLVLVEDAAEPIASAYVETADLARIGDRRG